MNAVKRLASRVTGIGLVSPEAVIAELEAADVPVSNVDCRFCADPCDAGHEDYPQRFSVDLESDMRGSVKPYRRQVIISTGKTDWEREVTDEKDSLAQHLSNAHSKLKNSKQKPSDGGDHTGATNGITTIPGLFSTSDPTVNRLAILNGSHITASDDHSLHTVIILPDYKAVLDVESSQKGAEALWNSNLNPSLGRAGAVDKQLKTWTLPYNCVILLCSHKRRDNRCAIAAPKLESTFSHYLNLEGWSVDTHLEDLSLTGSPLEEIEGTQEQREEEVLRRLKSIGQDPTHKRALILKNSHIGGHKFAGNVIIYYPQGVSVWYGRVTPHEVCSVVQNTIIEGKILPTLLRGGMNLSKPGCTSLRDW